MQVKRWGILRSLLMVEAFTYNWTHVLSCFMEWNIQMSRAVNRELAEAAAEPIGKFDIPTKRISDSVVGGIVGPF